MPPATERKPLVYLVCSPGGHLTELLELQEAFDGCALRYFCYASETTSRLPNATLVPNRPYNPLRYAINLAKCWRLFRLERPILVASTGAEIAIPAFIAAKRLRIPTLYIECGAQVTHSSLTGRILIHIADRFLVQWPELARGKAQYCGSLIDTTPAK